MRQEFSEQLEEILSNFRRTQQQLADLAERADSVTGRAESPDGLISVEVGPGGEIRTLSIKDRALRQYDGTLLAETIREVVLAANADLATAAAERYRDVLGPGFDPERLRGAGDDLSGMIRDVSRNLYGR